MLGSSWDSGDYGFEACYYFSEEGLDRIRLMSDNPHASSTLRNALSNRYGDYKVDRRFQNIGIVNWTWRTSEKEIILIRMISEDGQPEVSIQYRDIDDADRGSEGL